jgi:hypothetical protein
MNMNHLQRLFRSRRSTGLLGGLLIALLAAAWISGCGVGTGGTGAFGSAPVNGFGSIFVGGIEFDDAGAVVTDDDGATVTRDGNELRLGMMADVEGATIAAGPNGPASQAASVRLTRVVVGPVSATDVGRRTFSVLGQTVIVNGSTAFDGALHGGLAALKAGDQVSVYGLAATSGQTLATRVESANASESWRLRGSVAGLDASAKRFAIGATMLDYSNAAYVPADLANGQWVHLKLSGTSGGGVLGVAAFGPAPAPPADAAHAEAEGVVSATLPQGQFRIGAISVDASIAAIDPAPAALVAGAHAQVIGRLQAGVLVAEKVKLLTAQEADSRSYQVVGAVGGLSGASFAVRGVAVDANAAIYVNGSAAQLANGAKVRVQGALSSDGTALRAARITFL